MTETARTLVYVLVGAAGLGVAWIARPATIERDALDDSGQRFFAKFDALTAKSMEIVTVDPETSARRAFKVGEVNGIWSIPSHENYPADGEQRLAQAAASVADLIKGTKASDSPADRALYGVVDPTSAGESVSGAGTRVTMQDGAGHALVDLIIGKAVKEAEGMHYVREPKHDRVYIAAVKTDQLSTKFEDWIERDLLKLEPSQIKEVFIDDYSIDELNQTIVRGDQLTLRVDPKNSWTWDGLAEGEALNTQKLQEMRQALDDLKIVDVHRKPAGLSAQLQGSGNMQLDAEAVTSLMGKGYYIVKNQLMSNEGETVVRMGDGVVYSLRFGEVVNFDAGSSDAGAESTGAIQPGRYVFVTATFNQDMIAPPQYEPLPDAPAASEHSGDSGDSGDSGGSGEAAATQPDAGASLSPETEAVADESKKGYEQACEAVTAANDQKREDHEKKIADAQAKVKQLNRLFADWYYVVGDAEYQKLRLRRADLVKAEAAAPTGGAGTQGSPASQ